MTALQFIMRVLIGVVSQPAVQDVLSEVGTFALRSAQKKIILEVENGISRYERKRSTPTVR